MQQANSKNIDKTGYFPALTGIRALAAYLVFFHHGNPFNPFARTAITGLPRTSTVIYLHHFVEQWHIGVTLFFVLSGFLITWRYESRIQPTWQWAKAYMQNRFARIYPLYFLLTVLCITCWWAELPGFGIHFGDAAQWSIKDKLLLVFMNLTLIKGFFAKYYFTALGQGWSLTVEEVFYATAPFVLLAVRKHLARIVFYPIAFLALGLLLVKLASVSPVYLYQFMPSVRFMLNWTFFGRVTEFAIGMALAFYSKRSEDSAVTGVWMTTLGVAGIVACLIGITQAELPRFRADIGLETYPAIVLNNLVLPLAIATFFWGLTHERSLLRRLLETKLFQVLGKSSYAFYLVHGGLLTFLVTKYTHNIILLFAVTLLVAYLLWKYIEEPLQVRLKAKAPQKQAVAA